MCKLLRTYLTAANSLSLHVLFCGNAWTESTLSLSLSLCLCHYLPICLSLPVCFCLSVCLSLSLSAHLSVRPSVCLCLCLSLPPSPPPLSLSLSLLQFAHSKMFNRRRLFLRQNSHREFERALSTFRWGTFSAGSSGRRLECTVCPCFTCTHLSGGERGGGGWGEEGRAVGLPRVVWHAARSDRTRWCVHEPSTLLVIEVC